MKVLVTGGAGFIGSHFIRLLLEQEFSAFVINLDKLTYAGNIQNVADLKRHPRYRFIRGDIVNHSIVQAGVKGCEAVVHFAAENHVDRSIQDAAPFLKTNVLGTQVLLETATRHKIKRFIQVSTDEVYGSTYGKSFSESDPLKPSSPYAASKAAGDLLALSYYTTFKLPVIITRSANNYGPCQYPEKFIPLFIARALEKKPLPLYGNGRNVRNWLFVRDNASAILNVFKKGRPGEIYNISGSTDQSNIVVARKLVSYVSKLSMIPKNSIQIQYVTDRLGHDKRYAISSQKIRKKLGWKPTTPFEKGLQETVLWYINAHRMGRL